MGVIAEQFEQIKKVLGSNDIDDGYLATIESAFYAGAQFIITSSMEIDSDEEGAEFMDSIHSDLIEYDKRVAAMIECAIHKETNGRLN